MGYWVSDIKFYKQMTYNVKNKFSTLVLSLGMWNVKLYLNDKQKMKPSNPQATTVICQLSVFENKDRSLKARCWQREMLYKRSNMLIFPCVGILHRSKKTQWHILLLGQPSQPLLTLRNPDQNKIEASIVTSSELNLTY